MSGVVLDWSSAEVRDGDLEVALQGKLLAGWKDAFDRTATLLHGGEWGAIKVKKDRLLVEHLVEGCEDRLRHFLESVIQQANATVGSAQEETPDTDGGDDDGSNSLDAAMTQRFRSFDVKTDQPDH